MIDKYSGKNLKRSFRVTHHEALEKRLKKKVRALLRLKRRMRGKISPWNRSRRTKWLDFSNVSGVEKVDRPFNSDF